jgi:hypothetical protein
LLGLRVHALARRRLLDWRHEAVSAIRQRCDETFAEQFAQGSDVDCEVALLDHASRPHQLHQFVLGNDSFPPLHERQEQVERTASHGNLFAIGK